jgi:dipeptidyl aminopeptidase/acylaminoacyl peptidase
MLRLVRAVLVTIGVMAAVSGLAMAAGHVGLTSDDGLRIVFLSAGPWTTEIWLTKPDGTSLNLIRENEGSTGINCSFYDNRILMAAFSTESFRTTALTTITADGRDFEPLIWHDSAFAAFSPNGRHIAFDDYNSSSTDEDSIRRLVITANDGLTEMYHSQPIPSQWLSPAWSPDSRQIAFLINQNEPRIQSEIAVLDIASQGISYLTDTFESEVTPKWSPDGTQIVFASGYLSPESFEYDIYTMSSDGSNVTRLTFNEKALYPSWSPNGQQIAYSYVGDTDTAVHLMNADGSNDHPVANIPGRSDGVACWLYVQDFPEAN